MGEQPKASVDPSRPAVLTDDTIRKLLAIVECSSEAIVSCNRAGQIETWNPGAAQMFGYAASEIRGRSVMILLPPSRRAEFAGLMEMAAGGQGVDLFRTLGEHKRGRLIDLSATLSPLKEREEEASGVLLVARDVSARRRLEEEAERTYEQSLQREAVLRDALTALRKSHEELKLTQLQLIQAAKLESVGRLASGVAHEVKNPLAIILAGTEYLLSQSSLGNGPIESVLRDIRAAVERANAVIGGLLNYSAATELNLVTADLNAVIEQALLLVQHALNRGHVRVVKELAEGLPELQLDTQKIEQVFINLLINAIDAMSEGGTLTIRTRRTRLTAADEAVGYRRTDPLRVGESVVLTSIEDTGSGIPPEHVSKLFDPFFSTKPTGRGTGLGLAVSKTIAGLHGGTIWVSNRPEGGAVATVVLRSPTT